MSALVVADLHFSDQTRDSYRHDFVAWFLQTIKKQHVDGVVIAGDITDQKDHHSAWLVNRVVAHLAAMAKLCPVIVLTGNHDTPTGNAQDAFFGFSGRLESVTWVGIPLLGKNSPAAKSMGLGGALFLPFTANYKRDWAELDFAAYNPIFAHQTFTGALGENGRKLEGTPVNIFPKDAMVIAGDIHVPQVIGPVTYCGAPYTKNFGDAYQGRILKLDGRKLTSIEYGGPQKHLMEIELGDYLPEYGPFAVAIKHALDECAELAQEGDILKVNVHVTDKEKWAEIKDAVMRWGEKRKVWVYSVVPVMAKAKQRVRGKVEARSDDELLGAFCKQRGLSESVAKTGRFLMEKA